MQRIMVATDLSTGAEPALQRAVHMARDAKASLRIVFAPPASATDEECAEARRALRQRVDAMGLGAFGEDEHSIRLLRGDPASAILSEAERFDPDIIILGAHGEPRLRDALFGTTALHVARVAAAPVLVVQNDARRPYRRVMAAVDDENGEEVLRLAGDLVAAEEFIVVHAYGSATESLLGYGDVLEDVRANQLTVIARTAARIAADGRKPPKMQSVIEDGDVAAILMKAWEHHRPDLLAMGTHGRLGLSWLFKGSVAETVMLSCPADILVVRTRPAKGERS